MAQIECGRGHLYDPEKYPTCPYCNTNQQITVAAAGRTAPIRTTDPSKTAPVSVTAAQKTAPISAIPVTAENRTMPPRGYVPQGAVSVTAENKTMPPRGYAPAGAVSVTEPQKTMPPRGYTPQGAVSVADASHGTVKASPGSTAPAGVVVGVKDGLAAVEGAGYMRLPCAEALTVGYAQLALDSSSKLAAGTGRGGLVGEVDGGTCGVIFC